MYATAVHITYSDSDCCDILRHMHIDLLQCNHMILNAVASIPIEAGRNLRPLKNGGNHIMHFSTRKLQGTPKK